MSRPHWLPKEVWLGVTVGEWPIQAFPSEAMATRWAAEQAYPKQRRIWCVAIPDDVPFYTGEVIPASTRIKRVDS